MVNYISDKFFGKLPNHSELLVCGPNINLYQNGDLSSILFHQLGTRLISTYLLIYGIYDRASLSMYKLVSFDNTVYIYMFYLSF